MAVSLCSGDILWHREHDSLTLKVYRLVLNADGVIAKQFLAEILPGCSAELDDEGVKFTIANPCPEVT